MRSERADPKPPLFHIRENVLLAKTFVQGFDYPAFVVDRRTVYAVTRALEIVSEASRRLPETVRTRHPHIPWSDIAGAGNVYRHDYEDVREQRLWRTVTVDLDPLLMVVEAELRALGEDL